MSVAAFDSAYAPFFIAWKKGYYSALGLDVHFIHMGGSLSNPALISGQLGISTSSASAMTAILRGYKLKEILTNVNHPAYELIGKGSIHSLTALKGKTIGIQGRGDTTQLATDIVLGQVGLHPSQVVFEVLGFQNASYYAALTAGRIDAVVMAPQVYTLPQVKQALAAGRLRVLANYGRKVELMMTGAATSDTLIRQQPSVVEHFVQATLRGLAYSADPANEADVVRELVAVNKQFHSKIPEAQLKTDLVIWRQYFNPSGVMSQAAEKQNIDLLAQVVKAKSLPVAQVYDDSFAQQASRALKAGG